MANYSTRFITDSIDYLYGLVFAGCCGALVLIVYFFVIESRDRTLEEIDTMYVRRVSPIKSGQWDTQEYRKEISRISSNLHAREGVDGPIST
jgi:SP family sugar:H+ symporter-like MFS transporter